MLLLMRLFKNNNWPLLATASMALLLTFSACVDTEFDEPPTGGAPVDITPNMSIAQLRALHVTSGGYDSIPADAVFSGVVVMDDRSGNYYKTLVIQDSTGGIEISFNDGYLYTSMPVGRTIYVRGKGLLLSDYEGLIQVIGSVVEEGGDLRDFGLTEAQVRTNVVKGAYLPSPPVPKKVKINDINDSHLSTLIELENVEFIGADTLETYADPVTNNSLNRTLQDCNGNTILVRTSGYADFAAVKTPRGKGTLVGVLGVFRDDLQLYIRDTTDVNMVSLRCGEVPLPPEGFSSLNETFSSVASFEEAALAYWANVAVVGAEKWEGRGFSGNQFVQASAFNASPSNVETWLITAPIDMRTQKTLSFRSSWGFYKHQGLTVWVSTDFNGSNAATATWQPLNPILPNAGTAPDSPGSSYCQWVSSGNVPLPVYNGKGYIGFKYVGDSGNNTTTWRVDDVNVQ